VHAVTLGSPEHSSIPVDAESPSKYAEIHLAVTRGNVGKLQDLLVAGVDVDLRTEEGFTTLHIAVARSQPEIVQLLLEAGADVSIGDKMAEHTPLHLACVAGNVRVVQLLLEYAANTEQVDKAGFYPFHHAVAHKNREVAEHLLMSGFDPNIASQKDGVTALHMAAEFNHLDIMRLLLAHGAAVDQPDSNKLTPLHRATMADNRAAAQILLQWGADVLAENSELRTPLKLAQSMSHNKTVEVLQKHAREEAEMMMAVRAELTEKRKQQTMAVADSWPCTS
jgi:ankyrin